MFSTTDGMRSEILSRMLGVHVWNAVELELSSPFLLVSARAADVPGLARTFLVHARGLESILEEASLTVVHAALATPPRWNRSLAWRLEQLREAWRIADTQRPRDGYGWVYRVEGGAEYYDRPEGRRRGVRGLTRIYPPKAFNSESRGAA
jgi:hypothetical protein